MKEFDKRKPLELSRGFIRDVWCYSRVRPTGFEPVTLCSGGIRSNPTELRAHIYLHEEVKVVYLIV